jgi:enamine deaminase RidA (YjgF/YER057c/UK114 family)
MPAKRQRIQPEKLHVRKDGGKVLYSQVMVVEVGGTRQIFVAGQTPRDRRAAEWREAPRGAGAATTKCSRWPLASLASASDGNCIGVGDMRAQIEQVGNNIKDALEAAGATLADIVKTTTYVTDMDEYFKHQGMRMRFFADALPTSTTVQVARFALASEASSQRAHSIKWPRRLLAPLGGAASGRSSWSRSRPSRSSDGIGLTLHERCKFVAPDD